MINNIVNRLKFRKHYREWKEKNLHNHAEIRDFVPIEQVEIGTETYGMINVRLYDNKVNSLRIGSFCSISENTYFVFGEHNYKRFSTFPFRHVMLHQAENEPSRGDIVVEDDVWIGFNSIILSGVTIHQGAVIGAGSVVAKDIPPYAIYAGGRIIGYRFEKNVIDKLLQIDFRKINKGLVDQYENLFYENNIEEFLVSNAYSSICGDKYD